MKTKAFHLGEIWTWFLSSKRRQCEWYHWISVSISNSMDTALTNSSALNQKKKTSIKHNIKVKSSQLRLWRIYFVRYKWNKERFAKKSTDTDSPKVALHLLPAAPKKKPPTTIFSASDQPQKCCFLFGPACHATEINRSPDCRAPVFAALNRVLQVCNDHHILRLNEAKWETSEAKATLNVAPFSICYKKLFYPPTISPAYPSRSLQSLLG